VNANTHTPLPAHGNGTRGGPRGSRLACALVLAIMLLVSALGSQAASAAVNSRQGPAAQAVPASGGVTTHYYYPSNSRCLWAYNVADGTVTANWPTDLCRQLDPNAGAGVYDYYRNEAGPSAWFMKMSFDNGYVMVRMAAPICDEVDIYSSC
jgi:hypothetical protein